MTYAKAIALVADLMLEQNLKQKSINNMKCTMRDFSRFMGKKRVESLTVRDVMLYQKDMHTRGFKHRTILTYIIDVKSFVKRCNKLGICKLDHSSIVTPRKIKVIPPYLTAGEVAEIVMFEPSLRNKAMIATAFSTGARATELVNMRVRDYDGKQITLRVTKTGTERKSIISRAAHEHIARYLDSRYDSMDYLFATEYGTKMTTSNLNLIFKKAGQRSGVRLYPHLLRHSHATHFLKEAHNIRLVQKSLGHSNIQSTQIYTHIDNGDLIAAHAAVF